MTAFSRFFKAVISSMRSSMRQVPCFLCGEGQTHIQQFKDGLASSIPFYGGPAWKSSGKGLFPLARKTVPALLESRFPGKNESHWRGQMQSFESINQLS